MKSLGYIDGLKLYEKGWREGILQGILIGLLLASSAFLLVYGL